MTELKYQELVEGYYDNLNNNLRNFKGGPGFLETWVHDEDHNRSLLEILDLAHENGISDLKVDLPKDVASEVNLDWLRRNAIAFGSVDLTGTLLTYSNKKASYSLDELTDISAPYSDAVSRQLTQVRHEGDLENTKLQTFSAADGSGTLAVAIDDKGIVREAKHKGFKGARRGVMDAQCLVLEGRSALEGAEHSGIRLEAILRDPKRPLPVKGLMTPEIADPIFALPQRLVREIYKQYREANKIDANKRNFWRDPSPATWLELAFEDKLKQAQKVMVEACQAFGLQTDVTVTDIKNDTRFVLSYTQDKTKPNFGYAMIKLERWLRPKLGFEVELLLESIEDRNRRVERTKR
ncbi:MAG: hypothetical protein AB7F86_10625 [Bdellovibrionales bacterium]